ncbi:MAG: acyl carrier protein [Candidatus Competibacteraceae bacterium]|nr:acyl carrier protein [Candidatus Competibacteraceae bacterium]
MSEFSVLEKEVADLIIEALNLEDMDAADINPDAPLFGEGLGLDSIDALEIALALSTQYGLKLRSDDSENQHIFASLRALSQYVAEHRQR